MKRTMGIAIIIVCQLVFFGAFIYCANTAHLLFPLREPAAIANLPVYLSLKSMFWGLYAVALHAMAFPARYIYRSRPWSGLVWLNVCSLAVFCLSICMEILFDYAYFKLISEMIQFSVLLISVNIFYFILPWVKSLSNKMHPCVKT